MLTTRGPRPPRRLSLAIETGSSSSVTTTNSVRSARPVACSPRSLKQSRRRRAASGSYGYPPLGSSALAQLRRGDPARPRFAHPRTPASTVGLNLRCSVTVSPDGGPPNRPDPARSCSPKDHATTPRACRPSSRAPAGRSRRSRTSTGLRRRTPTSVCRRSVSVIHIETRRNDDALHLRARPVGPQPRPLARPRHRPPAQDARDRTPPPPRPRCAARRLRHPTRPSRVAATTIAAAQGLTVDETHVIVTPRYVSQRALYRPQSRPRQEPRLRGLRADTG